MSRGRLGCCTDGSRSRLGIGGNAAPDTHASRAYASLFHLVSAQFWEHCPVDLPPAFKTLEQVVKSFDWRAGILRCGLGLAGR